MRLFMPVVFWLSVAALVAGAEDPPGFNPSSRNISAHSDGDAVLLPRFVVESTRINRNSWKYVSIPGFEILSQCDDSKTIRYVRALLLGEAVQRALLPETIAPQFSSANTVILYDSPPTSLPPNTLIPAPPTVTEGDSMVWGDFTGHEISPPLIAYESDAKAECSNLWDIDIGRSVIAIFSNSLQFRLRRHAPKYPAWFVEGLFGKFGLYANYGVNRHGLSWLSPSFDGIVAPAQLSTTPPTVLPIQQLFSVKSPSVDSPDSTWFATAGLFVRWGMYFQEESRPNAQDVFWRFVRRATNEPVTEQLFTECFGFGFEEMKTRLEQYLPLASSAMLKVPIDADSIGKPPKLRTATETEIARIVGDWERMMGNLLSAEKPGLAKIYMEEAGKLFSKSSALTMRDPQYLGTAGLYHYSIGNEIKARELIEAAVKGPVFRPNVYLTLARLRYLDFLRLAGGSAERLSEKQVAAVLEPLVVALNQTPALAETYRLIANMYLQSTAIPSPEGFELLERGIRLFRDDTVLADRTRALRAKVVSNTQGNAL
jgi:hypothetical protein